jgi:glycosyltransferase involved in cell wall biosynthesis
VNTEQVNKERVNTEHPKPAHTPIPGGRIVYIDTEWFAGPLYRLARWCFPRSDHAVFMISQLDWFVFDAFALRRLRREIAAGERWSLLHVVTPITTAAPTRLHRLGLPVVRGPLNCGLGIPPGFERWMRADAMGLSRARVLARLLETAIGSLRRSARVLVASAATLSALPPSARARAVRMIENAVDSELFFPATEAPESASPTTDKPPITRAIQRTPQQPANQQPAKQPPQQPPQQPPRGPLRIVFVGRLVPFKALPLLLGAMARLRAQGIPSQLEVVGDGPMAQPWRTEANALALGPWVRWRGSLAPAEVAETMRRADVFCLPSIRESGGAVLLEAMACGLPVIAMNFGGPAEVLSEAVGWKIAMPNELAAIDGIAQALRAVYQDPEGAKARGAQGRREVLRKHTWKAKLDAAERLYEEVLLNPLQGAVAASRPPEFAR